MKTRNIIFYLIGLLAFCSCQDMFEPADENTRQEDAMYEESKYADGLLQYGYGRLPYKTNVANASNWTDVATDDAVTNEKTNSYLLMATGSWASDNNPVSEWDNCKDGIQYVNLFLEIVEKVKWAPSATSKQEMFTDRLKGEAFGLRAIFYYYLLRAHGGYVAQNDTTIYGVPLLTSSENGSSDYNQKRATFRDCVKQIFADCDSAMALLPYDYANISTDAEVPLKYKESGAYVTSYNLIFGDKAHGLLSGKVAAATKAQAALLAASPAFRKFSGVTSAEAADLCANVIKRNGGLEGFDKTGNRDWFQSAFKSMIETVENPEIIWREDRQDNFDQERDNFPPTLYGNGRINPSQNLVDAFPMRNGFPIGDVRSGYNAKDPYVNRDPRLDYYIIYNGRIISTKKKEIISGTYPNVDDETDDNLNSINKSTRTGYYLLKFLREDASPLSSSQMTQKHIYPRIRFTEIYLAYAEAANDAWGPTGDGGNGFSAYDVIKAIRDRAGLGYDEYGRPLPEGDVYLEECAKDQAMMTNLIRNERRLELCFENKRFWDMRRWMLPLNEPVKGMKIDRNETTGDLTYTIIEVEERKYDNGYQIYGPIPKGEVLKWGNLKQNWGW